MAFCPNCGTPNTEQAERCVACGYELIVPKQKAKFKGTIMMSGIKAPTAGQPEAPAAPPPAPTKSSLPPPAAAATPPARNLNYQKTMMGQPPILLPSKPEPKPAAAPPAAPPPASVPPDLGTMPTMQGNSPVAQPSLPPFSQSNTSQSFAQPSLPPHASNNTREFQPDLAITQPTRPQTPVPSAPASVPSLKSSQPTFSGSAFAGSKPSAPTVGASRVSMGGAYESTMPPAAPPNPAKVIAIGCGVVLALLLVVGGVLWFAFGDRIKLLFGGESDAGSAEAAAWHASISQSLTKVNELCQSDCAQAGVFFHPLKQAALLGEARALTPERLAKLNDPVNAKAAMLDHTDDAAVATQLGLDPQQCARVVTGAAKVISCSVPDPSGKPSVLRIVALNGISSL